MKHLVIAAASLVSSITLAHAKPLADDHIHLLERGKWIMTTELAPTNVKLREAEGSFYDGTRTADATDLDKPRVFTVLGSSGSCRVETTKRVFVGTPSARGKVAIELDTSSCKLEGGPVLAIDGATDVSFNLPAGVNVQSSTRVADWVEHTFGKNVAFDAELQPRVFVEPVTDDVALVTAVYTSGASELIVRRGETALAHFNDGSVLGILHDHGDRLVVSTRAGLRTIAI